MQNKNRKNNRLVTRIISMIMAAMLALLSYVPAFAADSDGLAGFDATQNSVLNENDGLPDDESGEEQDPEPEPEPCVHEWSSWKTIASATYFKTGKKTRECLICSEVETATIAKKAAYNKWIKENGKKYYMNSKGVPVKFWNKIYLNNSKTGSKKWCYFSSTGVYQTYVSGTTKNKWVWVNKRKHYFNSSCKPLDTGFHFINGRLYYMGKNKYALKGKFLANDGHNYTANKNCVISGLNYYKYKYKSFILVDISAQKLYLYKNKSRVLYTSVVTGKNGYNTPTGIYSVGNKCRNIPLTGPDWDVHVSYWVPFIGGAYGFHDASWRPTSDFDNSSTHFRNGSHGCVNMRTSAARTLYSKAYRGLPVIIRK